MNRREYTLSLFINKRHIEKVIIDSHFEKKHTDSISDEIILELVSRLDKRVFQPVNVSETGFE